MLRFLLFTAWIYVLLAFAVNAQNASLSRSDSLAGTRQTRNSALMGKMSLVQRIRVACSEGGMEVLLDFDQPFSGVIYSKGFYRASPECFYVQVRTNLSQYRFHIPAEGCGTQSGMQKLSGNDAPVKYFENTIIIQNEPELQEVWDVGKYVVAENKLILHSMVLNMSEREFLPTNDSFVRAYACTLYAARTLRCTWRTRMEQTVQFSPIAVNMLEAQTVQFGSDDATVAMAIQTGQGPFAPLLQPNQLLKIGDPLTLVMYIRATPTFDVSVRDCYAVDGRGRAQLQLTSADGCLLQPKLLGLWQTTRDTGNTGASIIVYAFMNTFKFPDDMEINVRCNIAICKDGCSGSCNRNRTQDDSVLLELQKTSSLQSGPPTEDSEEEARLRESRRRSTTTESTTNIAPVTAEVSSSSTALVELQNLSVLQNGPPTDDDEENARLRNSRRSTTTTTAAPSTTLSSLFSSTQDESLLLELQRNSLLQNGPPTEDTEEDAKLRESRRRLTSITTTPASSSTEAATMMNMNGMHPYHPRNPSHLELPPSPYQSVSLQDLIITPNKYEYVTDNMLPPLQNVLAVSQFAGDNNAGATFGGAAGETGAVSARNGQQSLKHQYFALFSEQQQIRNNAGKPSGDAQNRVTNFSNRQFSLLSSQQPPPGDHPVITHGLWNNGQGTKPSNLRIVKRSVGDGSAATDDAPLSDSQTSENVFIYPHPMQSKRTGVLNLSDRLIVFTPEQIVQAAHELAASEVAATAGPLNSITDASRNNDDGTTCIATATYHFLLSALLCVIGMLTLVLAMVLYVLWRRRHRLTNMQLVASGQLEFGSNKL